MLPRTLIFAMTALLLIVGVTNTSLAEGGAVQFIAPLPGDAETMFKAISTAGVIGASNGGAGSHAFLWNNGQTQDITNLPPGLCGEDAWGFDNLGRISSTNWDTDNGRAFVLNTQTGVVQYIAPLLGDTETMFKAISTVGVIGVSNGVAGSHAFLWKNGQTQDITNLPPGLCGEDTWGFDNLGRISSTNWDTDNGRAFVLNTQTGVVQYIAPIPGDTETIFKAISTAGVIGVSNGLAGSHVFLWKNGQTQDITNSVPGLCGEDDWGFDDLGRISSTNWDTENGRAYVAVPEPVTLSLLALGGLAFIRRTRK